MYRIKYEGQPVTIEKMDIFEQEDQDVLIFRVKLELWLDEINGSLGVLDFKNDYPIYNPHIKIGYIKKGTGAKYITTDHDGKEIQAKDIILTTEENGTPEILFSQHDIESKIFSELSKHFDPFDMARLSSFIK